MRRKWNKRRVVFKASWASTSREVQTSYRLWTYSDPIALGYSQKKWDSLSPKNKEKVIKKWVFGFVRWEIIESKTT